MLLAVTNCTADAFANICTATLFSTVYICYVDFVKC